MTAPERQARLPKTLRALYHPGWGDGNRVHPDNARHHTALEETGKVDTNAASGFPQPGRRISAFIAGLPKAELHVHIEGTITPEQRRKFALRNSLPPESPYAGWDRDTTADPATYLANFLAVLFDCLSVLKTERDFFDLTYEFLEKIHADNVIYVELSFDPQSHITRDIPLSAVINGIDGGRKKAKADFGIESNLIMCINRERSAEEAFDLLQAARPFRDRLTGIGLDCAEEGNPPIKFRDVYAVARAEGYRLTAHCDHNQRNSATHIWQCIELLGCERIDHGMNCLEDPRLVDRLGERGTVMTGCPTWRPIDPKPRRMAEIRGMYDAGLKVTLNSDDPGVFVSGTLGSMLPPVAATGDFGESDLVRLMLNAFEGSWASREQRARFCERVNRYFREWLDSQVPKQGQ
ncbi:MAG: adenosine deaminase [Betaproteobacteria bacterium]|nr:adenosine deaminase [Betaproteobacteria bacterium]